MGIRGYMGSRLEFFLVNDRLREMGTWLKVNGEAIYETHPASPCESGDCVLTQNREGTAYAIILPKDDSGMLPESISIPPELTAKSGVLTLLGYGAIDPCETKDNLTSIAIPAAVRDKPPCAHAWAIKIAARL